MTEPAARIVIVDDHPLVREGLKQLLSGLPEFAVVAEADDLLSAQQTIAALQPQAAIVDLTLGADSGMDLVRWTRERFPDIKLVVLSMQDEALYAERLLRMGVSAYVMKSAAESDFITALRKAVRGQRHISSSMGERLLSKAVRSHAAGSEDPVSALTEREREVFELMGAGVSTREIAEQLMLSMKTVDAHRRHIREKLNLRSTGELLRYATQWVTARSDDRQVQSPTPLM